jgi:hypothetical protein
MKKASNILPLILGSILILGTWYYLQFLRPLPQFIFYISVSNSSVQIRIPDTAKSIVEIAGTDYPLDTEYLQRFMLRIKNIGLQGESTRRIVEPDLIFTLNNRTYLYSAAEDGRGLLQNGNKTYLISNDLSFFATSTESNWVNLNLIHNIEKVKRVELQSGNIESILDNETRIDREIIQQISQFGGFDFLRSKRNSPWELRITIEYETKSEIWDFSRIEDEVFVSNEVFSMKMERFRYNELNQLIENIIDP